MNGPSKVLVLAGLVLGGGGALIVSTSWRGLTQPAPAEPTVVDCARVPPLPVGAWVRLRGCRPLADQAMHVIRDGDIVQRAFGASDVESAILPLAPADPVETRPTVYLVVSPRADVDTLSASDSFEGTVRARPRLTYESELRLERLRLVGYGVHPARARAFDEASALAGALGMRASCPVLALAWLLGRRERRRWLEQHTA